jgi:threonyl-tRNA synthetase
MLATSRPGSLPDQVRVIPITDAHSGYAEQIVRQLRAARVRASADLSAERMNAKIRQAQLFKVPYMLVVGDREMEENTVALRKRDGSRLEGMPVAEFITLISDRIASRASDL